MAPKIYPKDASRYPNSQLTGQPLSFTEVVYYAQDHTAIALDLMDKALARTHDAFANIDAEKARDATRRSRQALNALAMSGIRSDGQTAAEFLQGGFIGNLLKMNQTSMARVDRAANILRFGGTIAKAKDSYNSPNPPVEKWWNQYLTKLEPAKTVTPEPAATNPATSPQPQPISIQPELPPSSATATAKEKKSSKLFWIGGALVATALLLTRKKKRK